MATFWPKDCEFQANAERSARLFAVMSGTLWVASSILRGTGTSDIKVSPSARRCFREHEYGQCRLYTSASLSRLAQRRAGRRLCTKCIRFRNDRCQSGPDYTPHSLDVNDLQHCLFRNCAPGKFDTTGPLAVIVTRAHILIRQLR